MTTTTWDAKRGDCHVLSFKDGLLSSVAHDLKIAVERWTLTYDPDAGTISGDFDARSLSVVCAMKDGQERHGTLSDRDKRKVAQNIQKDVLSTARHPSIRFDGSEVARNGDAWQVTGQLTICGRTRSITAQVADSGGHLTAEVRLHQPDFGIKPYSAMFGTLKIKPDVVVTLRVPSPETT